MDPREVPMNVLEAIDTTNDQLLGSGEVIIVNYVTHDSKDNRVYVPISTLKVLRVIETANQLKKLNRWLNKRTGKLWFASFLKHQGLPEMIEQTTRLMTREEWIEKCMNSEKKPLQEWMSELELGGFTGTLDKYYPAQSPVTEWQARVITANWVRGVNPEPDPFDEEVEVEVVVRAKVKEQYNRSDAEIWDDNEVAKSLLVVALAQELPDKIDDDRFCDGVTNLNGLIRDIEMDTKSITNSLW
jgi:hypothetical protein